MVLNDFLRGKIPWYIPDPNWQEHKSNKEDEEPEGEGRLGEMRKLFGREAEEGSETETGSWDGLNTDDDCEGDITDNDDTEGGLDEDQEREERANDPRSSKRTRHR